MVCEEDISLPLGNTDANCMSPSYPTATVSPGLIFIHWDNKMPI